MKTNVTAPMQCPNCAKPLPAGVLAGFCPACLLEQGTQTDDGGFKPPSLEELAKLFPQLEILGLLGTGGMGAVYQTRQSALDRMVALKIMPAAGISGTNFAERFNREARALARLNHPNIVTVYEFGQAGNLHFFLMEFVDGCNLRQLERAGRLSPRETLQLIPQICDALQYAHDQGVVHRDIKPENVLVDRKGRVKIADFGLAKILGYEAGSPRLTAEGQVMGTPHYMAPEQMEHPLSVDHRADIYSLGVVIYEMLTGDLPLGRFSPPSRKVQVDVRLDEVVLRALENDPACRYQRASEVKTRVEIIASGPAPPAATSTVDSPAPRLVHWAGFPLVVERHGARRLNWLVILRAWAILFGILTLAFGVVSAVTGRLLFGWLGIIGWPSLLPRAGMAALVVGWGLRQALRRPWDQPSDRTDRGTVILTRAIPGWRRHQVILPLVLLLAATWSVFQEPAVAPQLKALLGVSRGRVNQVAELGSGTGMLRASLPGGGMVELMAVGNGENNSDPWWRPDGSSLATNRVSINNLTGLPLGDPFRKYLVFRSQGLPPEVSSPLYDVAPVANVSAGGMALVNGRPLTGSWGVVVGWSGSVPTGAIRLGYGLDPWRTVVVHRPPGGATTEYRRPGDPAWSASVNSLSDEGGNLRLTMVTRPKDPNWQTISPQDSNWQTRVIAVDTKGAEHTFRWANGNPGGQSAVWTYVFGDLTLAQLQELRFQVRPVHWVEFRDVPLAPRLTAGSAAGRPDTGAFAASAENP